MATATEAPYSFADLHAQLGGIPLNRIRMRPSPGSATEGDLERTGKPVCELIDGVSWRSRWGRSNRCWDCTLVG